MTLNFTVGPVQSEDYICAVGGEQVPYFRNDEFSQIMFENERLVKKFVNAPEGSKTVFITGSGTASMEASVINVLNEKDRVLIINGGSFGARFVEICQIHGISFTEIALEFGHDITGDVLAQYDGKGYTALLVNVDETSSGVRYDMDLIGKFCRKNNMILIADIISSFLADENDMTATGADIYITGSQKALACQPGVSVIVMSPRALARIESNDPKCLYLDLRSALKNMERGQTPFTPAVGILRQINARLRKIDENGGVRAEIERTGKLAADFRKRAEGLPIRCVTESKSNAVTAYYVDVPAHKLFEDVKEKYDIWICPNGGQYRDTVFRVGHIGALTEDDNTKLLNALRKELKGE